MCFAFMSELLNLYLIKRRILADLTITFFNTAFTIKLYYTHDCEMNSKKLFKVILLFFIKMYESKYLYSYMFIRV